MTNDAMILKLLLVGEGDCSGALAMLRAYHIHHHHHPTRCRDEVRIALVVTTPLHSASELDATYPKTALYNIQQMEQILMTTTSKSHPPPLGSAVLYNIDACHLHTPEVQERLRQQLQWWLSWLKIENDNDGIDDNDGTTHPSPENDDNENDPTHQSSPPLFDMVLFQYPHLGIPVATATSDHDDDHDGDDESILRQRHVSLLHHYLYSASLVAPVIHVTLNVAQYQSWLVPTRSTTTINTAATTTDTPLPIWSFPDRSLQLQKVVPVQHSFHWIFPPPFHENMTPVNASTTTALATVRRVSKKYHGGNHRHYLSKFGYHHVRTITSLTRKKLGPVSLVGSCHYVFKCQPPRPPIATNDTNEMLATGDDAHHPNDATSCPICGVSCSDALEYERHVQNPTRYPFACHDTTTTTTKHDVTVDVDNIAGKKKIIITNADADNGSVTAVDGHCTTGTGTRVPMKSLKCRHGQLPKVMASIIPNENIGRRLRWFLQHAMHEADDGVPLSKRQSERLIHNGCVSIHDEVVTDSSRILHTVGQVVRVQIPPDNILGTTTCRHINNEQVGCDSKNETTTATLDETCDVNAKVSIVDTHPIQQLSSNRGSFLIVVWKPVGMRTIGSFTNDTLEQYLFHQHQPPLSTLHIDANSPLNGHGPLISRYQFKSLSKLDKGCGGLCVVVMQQQQQKQSPESSASIPIQELNFRIQHTYTALVYGNECPLEWKRGASILLPVHGLRRWKNRTRQAPTAIHTNGKSDDRGRYNDSNNNVVDDVDIDSCWVNDDDIDETEATVSYKSDYSNEMEATITVIEQTQNAGESIASDHTPPLSTISIATASTVSGLAQTIGYYLRRHNCSIVGDRMAVQEYNTLPRAVRNRIKQRLCLGCTGVRVEMPLQHNDETSSPQVYEQVVESNHPIPVKWSALHWQEFCNNSSKQDG